MSPLTGLYTTNQDAYTRLVSGEIDVVFTTYFIFTPAASPTIIFPRLTLLILTRGIEDFVILCAISPPIRARWPVGQQLI